MSTAAKKASLIASVIYAKNALVDAEEAVAKLKARLGELEADIAELKVADRKVGTTELVEEWNQPGDVGQNYPDGWVKQWADTEFTEDFDLEVKFRVDGPPRVGGAVNLISCPYGDNGSSFANVFIQTTEDDKLQFAIVVGTNYSNTIVYVQPSNYEDPSKVAFSQGEEMTLLIKARGDQVTVSYRDFETQIAAYCQGEKRTGGTAQVYTPGPPQVPITGAIHSAKLTTY